MERPRPVGPRLEAAIQAARDLAWFPTANLHGIAYDARRQSHEAFVTALTKTSYLDYRSTAMSVPEVRFLVDAMRRVAACSFSNRYGLPYYERKMAMAELRGCLVAWDRLTGAVE